jgi:hypothetical protein
VASKLTESLVRDLGANFGRVQIAVTQEQEGITCVIVIGPGESSLTRKLTVGLSAGATFPKLNTSGWLPSGASANATRFNLLIEDCIRQDARKATKAKPIATAEKSGQNLARP